jgi:predicted negative regulator of RcsB-dependent stress response
MRPEHRHELKTNELAEWLSNLPQWSKENLKTIIYVSVVIILVAAAYFWKVYQKNTLSTGRQLELTGLINGIDRSKLQVLQAQTQGVDYSFILINIANNLQSLAQDTKNDLMAALALIKQAQALRTELHYRLGAVSEQDVVNQINRAKAGYNEAISRLKAAQTQGKTDPSLLAMANLGLGLCEEEVGNFEQAKQIYRDITTNPQFKPTTAAVEAKLRLEKMDNYQSKVVFKPSPKPATAKLIQPKVPQGTSDVNAGPQSPNSVSESTAYLQETPNEVNSLLEPRTSANEVPNLPAGR